MRLRVPSCRCTHVPCARQASKEVSHHPHVERWGCTNVTDSISPPRAGELVTKESTLTPAVYRTTASSHGRVRCRTFLLPPSSPPWRGWCVPITVVSTRDDVPIAYGDALSRARVCPPTTRGQSGATAQKTQGRVRVGKPGELRRIWAQGARRDRPSLVFVRPAFRAAVGTRTDVETGWLHHGLDTPRLSQAHQHAGHAVRRTERRARTTVVMLG